jgi:hypothetical protein
MLAFSRGILTLFIARVPANSLHFFINAHLMMMSAACAMGSIER